MEVQDWSMSVDLEAHLVVSVAVGAGLDGKGGDGNGR